MASYKKIKDLVAAGNNGCLQWGECKDGSIWYSADDAVIRYTADPELQSMCRLYAKPRINIRMINDIIRMDPYKTLTIHELKQLKVHGMYIVDRDPKHYLAFSAVHVGEFLALKKELIFEIHMVVDKPVMVISEVYRNLFLTDFRHIAMIMGMKRC